MLGLREKSASHFLGMERFSAVSTDVGRNVLEYQRRSAALQGDRCASGLRFAVPANRAFSSKVLLAARADWLRETTAILLGRLYRVAGVSAQCKEIIVADN